MNDCQLLDEYRARASDAAFGAIVRRYAPLVYHACRRRLRDAHLADDVTQAVFLVLARRSPTSTGSAGGATLAGWLYRTARHACANAERARVRRTRHERIAALMRDESTSIADAAAAAPSADELYLDRALDALPASDRDVLFMRFYESRDIDDIARALGVSSNTSAKRISRALARLRNRFMTLRGATSSELAVSQALTAALSLPAPRGLVENVSRAVRAGTGGGAGAAPAVELIAKGVIGTMLKIKAQLVAAAAAGAVVLGVGGGLLSVPALFAQSSGRSAPATAPAAPATQPAAAPKKVLRDFAAAIRRADAQAMRSMVDAKDADNQRLVGIVGDYIDSSAELRKEITAKFGADAMKKLPELQQLTPIDYLGDAVDGLIDHLEEEVEGDQVTLTAPNNDIEPFVFVKVNGQWKISSDRITATWQPGDWDQRAGQIQNMTEAVRMLTQNVSDGQYKSIAELKREVQQMRNR